MRNIKTLFILAALSLAACSNNSINIDTHSEIVELSEKELNSIGGEKDQNITPENHHQKPPQMIVIIFMRKK